MTTWWQSLAITNYCRAVNLAQAGGNQSTNLHHQFTSASTCLPSHLIQSIFMDDVFSLLKWPFANTEHQAPPSPGHHVRRHVLASAHLPDHSCIQSLVSCALMAVTPSAVPLYHRVCTGNSCTKAHRRDVCNPTQLANTGPCLLSP